MERKIGAGMFFGVEGYLEGQGDSESSLTIRITGVLYVACRGY